MQHRKPLHVLLISVFLLLAIGITAIAAVYVHGYTRKDGTYVAPHYRSDPDSSKLNNWSTKGNTNPYTGKEGTKDPYAATPAPSYTAPAVSATPAPNSTTQSPAPKTQTTVAQPTETVPASTTITIADQTPAMQNLSTVPPPQTLTAKDYTVYITRTGRKYHSYGCRYLARSCIAIKKSRAIKKGYTACSVCNP